LTGLAGVLSVDDLQHRGRHGVVRERSKLCRIVRARSFLEMVEGGAMSVFGGMLARFFAVGIAAAGAFVIANYALDWL
jgi:hypothetical protein